MIIPIQFNSIRSRTYNKIDLFKGGAIPVQEGSYDGLIPEKMIQDAMLFLHPNVTMSTKQKKPTSTTLAETPTTARPLTSSTRQTTPTTTPSTTTATTTSKSTNVTPTARTTLLSTTSRKPTLNVPSTTLTDKKPGINSVSPTITLHEEPNCQQGMVYFNSELRGRMNAGLFIDLGKVRGSASCLKLCCEIASCNLVFMTRDRCYAVDCFNNEQCEPVPAVPYRDDMPSVYYVTRSGISILDQGKYFVRLLKCSRPNV